MPAPAFRTRSHSWPYQNVTNGDTEMPQIMVKIKPSMQCVPIPLRMALTWNIFSKTLNKVYNVLHSTMIRDQETFEHWPPILSNDVSFKVFREDTSAQITSDQWTRMLQPDVAFVVEFTTPELPPTFLAPSLLEEKLHVSSRGRAQNLQLNFLPSIIKGFEKRPVGLNLSGTGSPSLRSPTLPSINELTCTPAQSSSSGYFPPAPRFFSSITPPSDPVVVDEEDINCNTQWHPSHPTSHHMMDTSDDEMSYQTSSASHPWTTNHIFSLPPPVGLEPECSDSISEAEEYDEEEDDDCSGSDESNLWGDLDIDADDDDIPMSGVFSGYSTGIMMSQPQPRPAIMKRRQTHPPPTIKKHNHYSLYQSSYRPLALGSSSSSSRLDDLASFPTTVIDPHKVNRWERTSQMQKREDSHPASMTDNKNIGSGKRKRGGGYEEGEVETAFEEGRSGMKTGIVFGREIKRMKHLGGFLGVS